MAPSRRRLFLPSILLLLCILAPAAAWAQPRFQYRPRGCNPFWNAVPSANLPSGDSSLGSLAAISATDIWAVGSSVDGQGGRHTLTQHWDGLDWTIVASPDGVQPTNFLTAVGALGTGEVWAVGFSASSNPFDPQSKTLTEKWNGASWDVVDSPNPPMPGGGESANELYGVGVAGTDDVWVVGKTNDFTTSQSLILHWDGQQWTDFSTPDDGDAGWLTAIDVLAPDDIWAVGFNSVDFVQVNLIKHWNGQSWTNVEAPNVGPFVNGLQGVSATSPSNVWAVGFHLEVFGVDQVYQTSVLHWNGVDWKVVPSPNRTQLNNYLFDVVGIAAGDAWAVGFYDNGSQLLTMIQMWDGLTWSIVPSADTSDALNELTGVAAVSSSEVWTVGQAFGFFNWETLVEKMACPSTARSTRKVRR